MVAPRGPAMPTDAVASKGKLPHSEGGRGRAPPRVLDGDAPGRPTYCTRTWDRDRGKSPSPLARRCNSGRTARPTQPPPSQPRAVTKILPWGGRQSRDPTHPLRATLPVIRSTAHGLPNQQQGPRGAVPVARRGTLPKGPSSLGNGLPTPTPPKTPGDAMWSWLRESGANRSPGRARSRGLLGPSLAGSDRKSTLPGRRSYRKVRAGSGPKLLILCEK